jgi:hypothetical protein
VLFRSIEVRSGSLGHEIDKFIPVIREHAGPEDTILVMTHSPLIYVLADRHSPGYFDVVMPGTFRTLKEQVDFVAHLKQAPPAVIVWPRKPFDGDNTRGLPSSARRVGLWVDRNYRSIHHSARYRILVPIEDDAAEGS